MGRPDTTPFRDARNAVGLLTDVFDLALAGPEMAAFSDRETMIVLVRARDLGREFTKASRRVFNGYARKGTSDLYERVKATYKEVPSGAAYSLPIKIRELCATIGSMARHGLRIAELVMEDGVWWEQYARGKLIDPADHWNSAWHDHVSSALRLGADRTAIGNLECGWRFRDLTDRSHRGRNVRAAFEAAWLAGHYKFAKQLITGAK